MNRKEVYGRLLEGLEREYDPVRFQAKARTVEEETRRRVLTLCLEEKLDWKVDITLGPHNVNTVYAPVTVQNASGKEVTLPAKIEKAEYGGWADEHGCGSGIQDIKLFIDASDRPIELASYRKDESFRNLVESKFGWKLNL